MERRRAASVTLRATLERFFVKTLLAVERGVDVGIRGEQHPVQDAAEPDSDMRRENPD